MLFRTGPGNPTAGRSPASPSRLPRRGSARSDTGCRGIREELASPRGAVTGSLAAGERRPAPESMPGRGSPAAPRQLPQPPWTVDPFCHGLSFPAAPRRTDPPDRVLSAEPRRGDALPLSATVSAAGGQGSPGGGGVRFCDSRSGPAPPAAPCPRPGRKDGAAPAGRGLPGSPWGLCSGSEGRPDRPGTPQGRAGGLRAKQNRLESASSSAVC